MFANRKDAGQKLASLLTDYRDRKDTVVLGLPRGGVVTAFEVAKTLNLPLDLLCSIKITSPSDPECALGAITDTGEAVFNKNVISLLGITKEDLEIAVEKAFKKANETAKRLRGKKAPLSLKNKSVILVDDGMATGLSMEAAIKALQKHKVFEIVVAVPVAPVDSALRVESECNRFCCLLTPSFFYAVSPFYEDFEQITTEEVASLLEG